MQIKRSLLPFASLPFTTPYILNVLNQNRNWILVVKLQSSGLNELLLCATRTNVPRARLHGVTITSKSSCTIQ
jgi:hypothetical protein